MSIQITSRSSGSSATITPWVQYTPTFSGFGTPTGVEIFSRRVGDSLEIKGKFTSGTATGSEAQMTLGYNGVDSNVTSSDTTKIPSITMSGIAGYGVATPAIPYTLIEPSVQYITFGIQDATRYSLSKLAGTALLGSSNTLTITALVPIQGWT